MNEENLKRQLQESLRSMKVDKIPEFDDVWDSATERYRASRSRYRKIAGLAAAAAIAALAFALLPLNGNHATAVYLTEEDLMISTQWSAPSDVLLPEHRYDIYGELPVLIETNELNEGLQL